MTFSIFTSLFIFISFLESRRKIMSNKSPEQGIDHNGTTDYITSENGTRIIDEFEKQDRRRDYMGTDYYYPGMSRISYRIVSISFQDERNE